MKYLPHISSTVGLIAVGVAIYLGYQCNQKNKLIEKLEIDLATAKAASIIAPGAPAAK